MIKVKDNNEYERKKSENEKKKEWKERFFQQGKKNSAFPVHERTNSFMSVRIIY